VRVGPGRMRARRCQHSARRWATGCFAEAAAAGRELSIATSLGFHAARIGRLFRPGRSGFRMQSCGSTLPAD